MGLPSGLFWIGLREATLRWTWSKNSRSLGEELLAEGTLVQRPGGEGQENLTQTPSQMVSAPHLGGYTKRRQGTAGCSAFAKPQPPRRQDRRCTRPTLPTIPGCTQTEHLVAGGADNAGQGRPPGGGFWCVSSTQRSARKVQPLVPPEPFASQSF